MSDSEDDFMSDKFLVEAPAAEKSYKAKRDASLLKGQRAGLAKNLQSAKVREEQQRREGLNTSLFEKEDHQEASGSGGGKAMAMMMKMGWKVGEGLGKKEVEEPTTKRKVDDDEEDGEAPRGGIGSSSRKAPRTEPIRVSLWSGRKGLTARDPTPPPIPTSNRNPDLLDENKMAKLGQKTDQFRERQKQTFAERDEERKEFKARELLVSYDAEAGVKVSRPVYTVRAWLISVPPTSCHAVKRAGDASPPTTSPHLPSTIRLEVPFPRSIPITPSGSIRSYNI
jgi:hypothetical protein